VCYFNGITGHSYDTKGTSRHTMLDLLRNLIGEGMKSSWLNPVASSGGDEEPLSCPARGEPAAQR
jgi:hypothetical protein